jgi:hypothetical protein
MIEGRRGPLSDHLTSTTTFTLIMNQNTRLSSEEYEEGIYDLDWDLLKHLVVIACFMP